MKAKDIVKFKEPVSDEEKEALMVVIEMRGDRALVSDLRFSNWSVPPTDVYAVSELIGMPDLNDKDEDTSNSSLKK
jgi:hypothetical protein